MVFLLFPFAANLSAGTAPEFQLKSVIRDCKQLYNTTFERSNDRFGFKETDMTNLNTHTTMTKRICDFIAKNMGLIVLAIGVLSVVFPTPLGSIDTIWINPLLGVVMFGMGLTLNPTDFRIVFSRPKDIIIGCLANGMAPHSSVPNA